MEDGPRDWALHPYERLSRRTWFLALAWPIPGLDEHLRNESADERSHSPCLSSFISVMVSEIK